MPRFACTVYSKLYLPSDESGWSARPSIRVLERLHHMDDDHESSQRWICVLGEGEDQIRIALGDPVGSSGSGATQERQLYIPGWLLESAGMEGIGEEMVVHFERSEDLPRATNLKFQLIGEVAEGFDIRELLENPLSELGVIRQGQMIPVPVLEGVVLTLESCGGAGEDGYVFLDGAEVGLEIEGDTAAAAAPTQPARVPTPIPDDNWDMLIPPPAPAAAAPAPAAPPAAASRNRRFQVSQPSAFVPFSGTGHRLNG